MHSEATEGANSDKWMRARGACGGEQAVGSGDRGPIGICGSDWAAIQKPSSSGIHPGRGKARGGSKGGSIFETRKKGRREKRIPTPPSLTLCLSFSFFHSLSLFSASLSLSFPSSYPSLPLEETSGGPIGGRTFLQRSLTKRP